MKKFITGLVIGNLVGIAFGMYLEAFGLTRCVVEDGVDLNALCTQAYKEDEKVTREPKINSWRRKYSTPKKKHE
jgi:hypothetical protein